MMADDLDDGEFWLPSEILTDDDIIMDFDLPSVTTASTESETDEEDVLTRHLPSSSISNPSSTPSKGVNLSSSPQSTLCGFAANQGSSRGSPVGPVSPPAVAENDDGATWDLLYKAAGQVAIMKLGNETTAKVGTGFFDCSARRPLCPPPQVAPTLNNNHYSPSFIQYPPQFPPFSQVRQQQFNRGVIRRGENLMKNSSNRPLGLPPSAWPPLQAHKQQPISANGPPISAKGPPVSTIGPPMFVGPQPKRESVGTGVFLPRRPTETRKKSETNGVPKMKSGKGGAKSQNQQQKISKPPTTANPKAIQLPLEWTY